jgi:hypothetical protein
MKNWREQAELSRTIVEEIIGDLIDRGGFDGVWDDTDSEIQDEIRDAWIAIVRSHLPTSQASVPVA